MEMICGQAKAECRCTEPAEHEGNHKCRLFSPVLESGHCHGEWAQDGTPVLMPTGETLEEAMVRILGLME